MNVTKDYMQELCNEFDITTYTSRKSPNNDRFKFRVWNESKREYHCCAFGLSPSGELLVEWVMGFIKYPDPYIIERCTGMKDINGKLIYEGDVLSIVHEEITWEEMQYQVQWYESAFTMLHLTDNKRLYLYKHYAGHSTIIGNIHEPKWGIESEAKV